MKNLKVLMALISAAALTVPFTGCSNDDSSSDSTGIVYYDSQNSYVDSVAEMDEAEKQARDNAQTATGSVGEKVTIGSCDSTIKKVVFVGKVDPDNHNAEPRNLYAALVEVTNNTDENVTVSSLGNFYVKIDGGNSDYGLDSAAAITARRAIDDFEDLNFEAAPGETVSGYVTFATPTEWKELTLEYAPKSGENVYDKAVYNVTPDKIEEAE